MERGVLVQRSMGPRLIIVGGILRQNPAQVRFTEHDEVVDTFAPDRAKKALAVGIFPRGACGGGLVTDAHGAQSTGEPELLLECLPFAFADVRGASARDPFRRN